MASRPTGRLRIRRPKRNTDVLRSYKIFVDGDQVSSIKHGAEVVLEIPAGSHTVRAKIDWCASQPVTVNIAADSETSLVCCARGLGRALINMLTKPDDYISLEIAQSG